MKERRRRIAIIVAILCSGVCLQLGAIGITIIILTTIFCATIDAAADVVANAIRDGFTQLAREQEKK